LFSIAQERVAPIQTFQIQATPFLKALFGLACTPLMCDVVIECPKAFGKENGPE
jgi:hypothetical protein